MASIKCRNGETTGTHVHGSVEDVRACYAGSASKPQATFRENMYPGTCALCGAKVEAKAGRILPKDGGQRGYDVLHLAGECPQAQPTSKPQAQPERVDFSAVAGGYYATICRTGNNDYDFWYVKEGRKPGYRFVKRVLGGQGPIRISQPEAISALRAILAEGVDKCGDRFADEMQRCRDCGLPLTDEISRAERRGPVCRSK
jgi:Family of unknown function (DUF6011)